MAHNRKLGLGGVALTKARLPAKTNGAAASQVRDELETEIINSSYLEGAPFKWVTLLFRYGLVDEEAPRYQKTSKKYGDLPLTIEIDTNRLLDASFDELVAIYRKTTLVALVHAGDKYGLKVQRLKELLAEA